MVKPVKLYARADATIIGAPESGIESLDVRYAYGGMVSEWSPSLDEIIAMLAGATLCLYVGGAASYNHPPVGMWVDGVDD